MRVSVGLLCSLVTAAWGATIPRDAVATVTLTVPCESEGATIIPSSATSIGLSDPTSTALTDANIKYPGGSVTLGPVSNPSSDPSDLNNIVPKSNLTLHYGSNDTSTPDSNAQISVQMKMPSVMLEDISSVQSVDCSETGVTITFTSLAGYEKSMKEWPSSGDFFLFTNHLGNCDADFERGIFVVDALAFDQSTLTVVAQAEKSDFQSTAGSMQLGFGQLLSPPPGNTTAAPYSNITSPSKRDIQWDPTYSLGFPISLPPNTSLVSLGSYLNVTANTASLTTTASFSGHLDYDFWTAKLQTLSLDLAISLTATLDLTAAAAAAITHTFTYSPASLSLTPASITIPGILSLGPTLDFSLGAQLSADAAATVVAHAEAILSDGSVHVDLLDEANSGTAGWTPQTNVSVALQGAASVVVSPFVLLGVEVAVEFLGGLVDLGAGVDANATWVNEVVAQDAEEVGTAGEVTGSADGGACAQGLEYKSDLVFEIDGFVTGFYNKELYGVEVPVFDNCWGF